MALAKIESVRHGAGDYGRQDGTRVLKLEQDGPFRFITLCFFWKYDHLAKESIVPPEPRLTRITYKAKAVKLCGVHCGGEHGEHCSLKPRY